MGLVYLFLDVDGVLNSEESRIARSGKKMSHQESMMSAHLSDPLVARLDTFLDKTNASVVVSSTWRLVYPLYQIMKIMCEHGFKHEANVVGATPYGGKERGWEILSWMQEHCLTPDDVVIFDDCGDMVHLKSRLVQTDPNVGLQDKDIEWALRLLERKHA